MTSVGRPSLRELYCDDRSWRYLNGLAAWGQCQPFDSYDVIFKNVERLEVIGIDDRDQPLLSHLTSLQEATLVCKWCILWVPV